VHEDETSGGRSRRTRSKPDTKLRTADPTDFQVQSVVTAAVTDGKCLHNCGAEAYWSGKFQTEQGRWIQINTLPAYGDVQMRAADASGTAAKADFLACGNVLAFLYLEL
jgi:hypothetical protein